MTDYQIHDWVKIKYAYQKSCIIVGNGSLAMSIQKIRGQTNCDKNVMAGTIIGFRISKQSLST